MRNRRRRNAFLVNHNSQPLAPLPPAGNRATRRQQEQAARREHRNAVREAQRAGSTPPLPPVTAVPRRAAQKRRDNKRRTAGKSNLPPRKETTRVRGSAGRRTKASKVNTLMKRGIITTKPIIARRISLPTPQRMPDGSGGMQATMIISGSIITRTVTPSNSGISPETFGRWEMISRGQVPPDDDTFKPLTEEEITQRETDEIRDIEAPARSELAAYREDKKAEIERLNASIQNNEDEAYELERQAAYFADEGNNYPKAEQLWEEAEERRRTANRMTDEAQEILNEANRHIASRGDAIREEREQKRLEIVRWAESENERRIEEAITELKAGLHHEIVSEISARYIPGVSDCAEYDFL